MNPVRAALVDPAGASRSLGDALSSRGYEVLRLSTGEEVLRAAARAPIDVIVLDPPARGWDIAGLVRTLRSNPETAFVPILFLAARADIEPRIKGFQLGPDDFLPKPVAPADLETRLSAALSTRHRLEKSLHPPEASADFTIPQHLMTLRGSLDQISLPTLLTLFDMERKTGMLVLLYDTPQEKVRLHFSDGRVIAAQIDGKESPRNAELIYSLLGRSGGKFDFRMVSVLRADEIGKPTSHLLLEGARLLDEHRRQSEP